MELNYNQVIELSTALYFKSLKSKELSTENYISIHQIRVKLKKHLIEINEEEKDLFLDYELKEGDSFPQAKDFQDKLKAIRDKNVTIDKLNFIEPEEFRKWTEDVEEFILAEYLLKN